MIHRWSIGVAAAVIALSCTGCNSWKRVDTTVGLLTVPNVDTDKVDGRQVIRMRGRLSSVTIDPVGARVIDFHVGRRPKWISEKVDPRSLADPTYRLVERPQKANVLSPPGWMTTVEVCPALDASTYWQVEAWGDHLVLLSDKHCGLRWRKTFDLHRESATLDITVELENVQGKPLPHGAVTSHLASATELTGDSAVQRGIVEGQQFERQWLAGPSTAELFAMPAGTLRGYGRLTWRERWMIKSGTPVAQPGESVDASPSSQPTEGR